MTLMTIFIQSKGGPGSGNWGHRGIPGKVGGSSPRGAGMSPTSGKDWLQRYEKRAGKKHPSASKPKPKPEPKPVTVKPKPTKRSGTPGDSTSDSKASGMLSKSVGKHWVDASMDNRAKLKSDNVNRLSQRAGIDKSNVNSILKKWAGTSNDDSPSSLSMQEAASEEFGVPLSDWQKDKVGHINANASTFGSTVGDGGLVSRDKERSLLRAMYNDTQRELREAGYKPGDTINLHRGFMTTRREGRSVGDVENYQGNAIESWSVGDFVAQRFARNYTSETMHGIVASMSVPIENVLSLPNTGLGCITEGEFVVLGSLAGSKSRVTYAT